MSLDGVAAGGRIVLLAIPHPASRRVAAYFQTVLAAGDPGVECVLETSPDRDLEPGDTAIYLRSAAADAVELAVMADSTASPDVLAAHALVADLDDRWRHISPLALESVLDKPEEALRTLFRTAGQPLDERVFAAAELCLPSLRDDLARYGHPLAYFAAVEAGSDYDVSRPPPPRTILVLTGPPAALVDWPLPDAHDRVVTTMPIVLASTEDALPPDLLQGVIHLHHVHGAPGLSEVLDALLARLAPRGRLSGEEITMAAAEAVVGQLTLNCNHRGMVLVLSGRRWQASPQSWWR